MQRGLHAGMLGRFGGVPKRPDDRWRKMNERLRFWSFPVLLDLADAWFRHESFPLWTGKEWGFYALSLLVSFLVYAALQKILYAIGKRSVKAERGGAALLAFPYAFIALFSFGYHHALGTMPNVYTLGFLLDEPRNAWTIFRDSFSAFHVLALAAFWFGAWWLLAWAGRSRPLWNTPWWGRLLHLGIALGGFLVLHNNIRFADQSLVVDVNAAVVSVRTGYVRLFGLNVGSSGLLARSPAPLPPPSSRPPCNVLLILCESLNRDDLSLYGGPRPTTPCLDSFRQRHSSRFTLFRNARTNSTTTLLSVPSILTGTVPVQPSALLHRTPLLWEYARAAGCRETFFITPQSHNWYNFKRFFAGSGIGHLWNKETAGLPEYNDVGGADKEAVREFERYAGSLGGEAGTFAGVLQFNATHFPYRTPPGETVWPGKGREAYQNSVHYQDKLIGEVLETLEKRGLLENTLILFSSDHGEAFGEHGQIGHLDCNYIETLKIPMWIYVPPSLENRVDMGALAGNRDWTVQNADLVPTVLDALGISRRPEVGRLMAALGGRSLFRPLPQDRDVFTSNNNEASRYEVGLSLLRGGFHYLLRINVRPVREELYDLRSDPFERKDLWHSTPAREKEAFRNALREHTSSRLILEDALRRVR